MSNELNITPLVSIGLAVYNGEKYLDEAIRSILAQTYTNFELIISDNASTDSTPEICKKYAEQDLRIRYSRNKTNIGGANNENLTFTLSKGKYFRWAAHDDYLAPTLIEKCVKLLENNPEIVLCYSQTVVIDEINPKEEIFNLVEGTAASPVKRLIQLTKREHKCIATYGLLRSEILRKTRLQQNYTGSDYVLLCEIAFYGKFYQLQENLFFKRMHTGNQYKDWRGRMAWFFPELKNTGKLTFPNWQQCFDYFVTIHRVPLSLKDKMLSYLFMIFYWIVYSKRLVKDLVVAIIMLLSSKESRKLKYTDVEKWS